MRRFIEVHKGRDLSLWGQGAMRHALSRESFPSHFRGSEIVGNFSSIGATSAKWLFEMQKTFSRGGVAQGEEPPGGESRETGVVNQQLGIGPLQLVWITVEEVG